MGAGNRRHPTVGLAIWTLKRQLSHTVFQLTLEVFGSVSSAGPETRMVAGALSVNHCN
jgi:hypothetical protein